MSEYTKPCRDCKEEIRMSNDTGKLAAYELDGTGFHSCKQTNEPQKLTLEMLDIRLKRLENMLFKQGK